MKNKIYYLGIIVCILIVGTSALKIMHIEGANILLLSGLLLICFVFLPAAFVSCYYRGGKKKKVLFLTAFLSLFFNFIAAIFRIMHWPGHKNLFLIGIILPLLIFLPVYLYFYLNEKEEPLKNFLYIISFLVFLYVMNALLSLNISHYIMMDTTRVSEVLNLSAYHKLKNELIQNSIQNSQTEIIKNKTNSLLHFINTVKSELILEATHQNIDAISENNEILLWKIRDLNNRFVVATIMEYKGRGAELKKEFEDYYHFLTTIPAIKESKFVDFIDDLYFIESEMNNAGFEFSWDDFNEEVPLISVIIKLTEMENSIQLASQEAMTIINSGSDI